MSIIKKKNLVDVVAGPLKISEIEREVRHYIMKSPTRLIVDIRRTEKGYQTTIYIDKETFERRC